MPQGFSAHSGRAKGKAGVGVGDELRWTVYNDVQQYKKAEVFNKLKNSYSCKVYYFM